MHSAGQHQHLSQPQSPLQWHSNSAAHPVEQGPNARQVMAVSPASKEIVVDAQLPAEDSPRESEKHGDSPLNGKTGVQVIGTQPEAGPASGSQFSNGLTASSREAAVTAVSSTESRGESGNDGGRGDAAVHQALSNNNVVRPRRSWHFRRPSNPEPIPICHSLDPMDSQLALDGLPRYHQHSDCRTASNSPFLTRSSRSTMHSMHAGHCPLELSGSVPCRRTSLAQHVQLPAGPRSDSGIAGDSSPSSRKPSQAGRSPSVGRQISVLLQRMSSAGRKSRDPSTLATGSTAESSSKGSNRGSSSSSLSAISVSSSSRSIGSGGSRSLSSASGRRSSFSRESSAGPTASPSGNGVGPVTGRQYLDRIQDYYTLDEAIGRGQSGFVCACTQRSTGQRFACKTVAKAHLEEEGRLEELRREVGLLHALKHDNVVAVEEVFEDATSVHIVMELCTGGDLADFLLEKERAAKVMPCMPDSRESAGCTEREAASLLRSVLQVVQRCHAMSVCHRDVKLANFMLSDITDRAVVKAIDFGSATFCRAGDTLTEMAGSPSYMAPEVLDEHYGLPCDVWSAGVMLYTLLVGYPPFEDESVLQLFKKIREAPLDLESGPWQRVSEDAKEVIRLMLNRDPAARPQPSDLLGKCFILDSCNLSGCSTARSDWRSTSGGIHSHTLLCPCLCRPSVVFRGICNILGPCGMRR